jgi:hypothetical protein
MNALYSYLHSKENKELRHFYNQTARITAVFMSSSMGRQGFFFLKKKFE